MRTSSSAAVGDLVRQHFDRIVVVDADVVAAVLGQRIEQAADARRMHFDADVVALADRAPRR